MSTMAAVGVRKGDGWAGTVVGHDGHPSSLGEKLLNAVVDAGGRVAEVCASVASAPDGWSVAFSDRNEPGANDALFQTGRTGPPLVASHDACVRDQIAYLYLFDADFGALDILHPPEPPSDLDPAARMAWYSGAGLTAEWVLEERITFEPGGAVAFRQGPSERTDWRNRRTRHGTDDPEETYRSVCSLVAASFPAQGRRFLLTALTSEVCHPRMTAGGMVFPLWAGIVVPQVVGDPHVFAANHISEVLEHDSFLLLPRRVMTDRKRCQLAVQAAIDTIAACARAGQVPTFRGADDLVYLFPTCLLDPDLDGTELTGFVRESVAEAFTSA